MLILRLTFRSVYLFCNVGVMRRLYRVLRQASNILSREWSEEKMKKRNAKTHVLINTKC